MSHTKSITTLHIALLGTLLVAGMLPSSPADARLFKWTDEHGETHYGDRPPPVNTRYGHQVLNNGGLKLRTVDRELTAAERLAASRVTQEMADKIRKERELARIDRLLAVSFPNVRTLNAARDDRLETLDDSIAYLQSRKDSLQEKHSKNTSRTQHFRRKNLTIPDQLVDEASTLNLSIAQLDSQIADIQNDREKTETEFRQYATRLEELLAQ